VASLLQQAQLLQIALDPQDVVYTPDWAVQDMVNYFQPSGRILEPCKGMGAFMKHLPADTMWCEIAEGKDFFAWNEQVDWCFGNPPYRMFGKWMYHSFAIAKDIVYLLPLDKPFISGKMMRTMKSWGSVKHMRFYGTGTELGFPMGFAVGALHFQKDYHGAMSISYV
jgi:hypothetical protein